MNIQLSAPLLNFDDIVCCHEPVIPTSHRFCVASPRSAAKSCFSLHSQLSLLTPNLLAAPSLISCFPTCCCPAAEQFTVNPVRVIVSVSHLIFPRSSLSLIRFPGDVNPSFTVTPMCGGFWFDFPRGSLTLFLFGSPLMKESSPSVQRQECLFSKCCLCADPENRNRIRSGKGKALRRLCQMHSWGTSGSPCLR